MDKNPETKRSFNQLIGGILVILLGLWFLLQNLGYDLPNMDQLWPIFPMLGGLAFIAIYAMGNEDDAGILIPGVSAFLIGCFFFLFTLDVVPWSAMARLWPVFPLIGGIAFLSTWAADRSNERDDGLLIVGGVASLVGVIGLAFTLLGFSGALIADYWPVILILVGVGLLAQNLLRR